MANKNTMRKTLEAIVLGGLMALGSNLPAVASQNYEPKKGDVYHSETVKKEQGFKVDYTRSPQILEKSKYPGVEGDKLNIIGYSRVCSAEDVAQNDATNQAIEKILDVGKSEVSLRGIREANREVYVLTKDGKEGYVVNQLFVVPMENFDERTQIELRQKYGKTVTSVQMPVPAIEASKMGMGEKVVGNVSVSSYSGKASDIIRPAEKVYRITNKSAPIINQITDLVMASDPFSANDRLVTLYPAADRGCDMNGKCVGKADGVITGKEARAFYASFKAYLEDGK